MYTDMYQEGYVLIGLNGGCTQYHDHIALMYRRAHAFQSRHIISE